MIAEIEHNSIKYKTDLSKPIDISLPLSNTEKNVIAWGINKPEFTPVVSNQFVGDVNLGGAVNFRNIIFNPHGHGTHTECVGHISKEPYTIHQCLTSFFYMAKLVSIQPIQKEKDQLITLDQIKKVWESNQKKCSAIVIRTLPNLPNKKTCNYSNTNPTYVQPEAITFLIQNGVEHLLIDTPSIDREEDGGKLLAHHAFWEYPHNTQKHRTITELIFVEDTIPDGEYLLNIQIASFENDASPSKPLLYKIIK